MKKRRKLRGFTLVELIIVMAIFSGIAVGAMAMVKPAMQIFHASSAQEDAVSHADIIARYIQDNLRYSENVVIYSNHGIKNIEMFIGTPFETCRQRNSSGEMINIPIEQSGDGKSIYKKQDIADYVEYDDYLPGKFGDFEYHIHNNGDFAGFRGPLNPPGSPPPESTTQNWKGSGTADYHQWINPVSYYAKMYFSDSICNSSNYNSVSERDDAARAYYADKVIYIMEITDKAEINIYAFPLKDDTADGADTVFYRLGHIGVTSDFSGKTETLKSSLNTAFNENVTLKDVQISNKPEEGIKMTLNVTYKTITQEFDFDYEFPVSFPNTPLNDGKTTVVETEYDKERACCYEKTYEVDSYSNFDWKDKFFSYDIDSAYVQGKDYTGEVKSFSLYSKSSPQYYCPTSSDLYAGGKYNADKAGYIYIVYSIPEIIP